MFKSDHKLSKVGISPCPSYLCQFQMTQKQYLLLIILTSGFFRHHLAVNVEVDAMPHACTKQLEDSEFELNLCALSKTFNVNMNIDSVKEPSNNMYKQGQRTVVIQRYYELNPFAPLRANQGFQGTNCGPMSSVCKISKIESSCEENGVCDTQQVTADAYGHSYNTHWSFKLTEMREQFVYGVTAYINMTAGPCYYCEPINGQVTALRANIEFYCDERFQGDGKLLITKQPHSTDGTVIFQWRTEHACYRRSDHAKVNCSNNPRQEVQCPFSCTIGSNSFQLPDIASPRVTGESRETFLFGLCIGFEVNLFSPCTKDTVICKKHRHHYSAVVSISKDQTHIRLRPYQFLWIFSQKNELAAVISFVCNEAVNKHDFSIVLLDNQLPPWFKLEGPCLCPNQGRNCGAVKTEAFRIGTTKSSHTKSESSTITVVVGIMVFSIFFVFVAFCGLIKKQGQRAEPNGSRDAGTNDGYGSMGRSEPPPAPPESSITSRNSSSDSWYTASEGTTSSGSQTRVAGARKNNSRANTPV